MTPREITSEERELLEKSGKEYYLYYRWEGCVVRVGGKDGPHIKFEGEEEFVPKLGSDVFYQATIMGDQITKEEYDNY